MNIDIIEKNPSENKAFDVKSKLKDLRTGFDKSVADSFSVMPNRTEASQGYWRWHTSLIDQTYPNNEIPVIDQVLTQRTIYETLKLMYHGFELSDGSKALSLSELSHWKINPEYEYSNLHQQAGYAAEIISTAKENIEAKIKGTGVTTCRADDLPELFQKNDQYVDKVKIDNNTGEILERIQTKFVGKNAKECLSKLTSKKYDKYYEDGMVDKLEVPKEFYPKMKKMIPERLVKLKEQLSHVENDPDPKKAESIRKQIEKYEKLDTMLKQSNTTSEEALFARQDPQRYMNKLLMKKTIAEGNKVGLESGSFAAGLTAAVSTVDNVQKFISGDINAQEAVLDIAKDTGTAGALGYGTAFVSTAVSSAMSASSHELIQSVATSGVPGIAISFGIDTYDSVVDFAQGNIDSYELAYDLGEGAAHIAGAMAGAELASNVGAIVGGAVGSVVPGAGTVAGAFVGKAAGYGVGAVGGMVGCALASEAYVTAVEAGTENAGLLAEKAKVAAEGALKHVGEFAPEKIANIQNSINEYAAKFKLPFNI